MKKVVRHQLKEDEFVSTMTRLVDFVKRRQKDILIAALAIAFLAFLYVGIRFIQTQKLKKESQVLSQILELRAELGTHPENLGKLEQLAGNGKFSRLAFVLEATYWVEKGDLEKSRAVLAKMRAEPKDFIYYQAQDLLGQIHTLEKNYDQAIAVYKKVEDEKPEDYGLDIILYHKAEALEAKGDQPEAIAVYKKIQEQFPQSYYGFDALQRIRKLESVK